MQPIPHQVAAAAAAAATTTTTNTKHVLITSIFCRVPSAVATTLAISPPRRRLTSPRDPGGRRPAPFFFYSSSAAVVAALLHPPRRAIAGSCRLHSSFHSPDPDNVSVHTTPSITASSPAAATSARSLHSTFPSAVIDKCSSLSDGLPVIHTSPPLPPAHSYLATEPPRVAPAVTATIVDGTLTDQFILPRLLPDPHLALAHRSTAQLLTSALVYKLCKQQWLVRIAPSLINLASFLRLSWLVNAVTRRTFFAQFCAGETEPEIVRTMRTLKAHGIGSILDVSIEADLGGDSKIPSDPAELRARQNVKADALAKEYERSIEMASQEPASFIALKVTGLASPELIYRLSLPYRPMRSAFVGADTDADGLLNYSEFKRCVLPAMPGADKVSSPSAVFGMVDTNNDGLVDWLDIEMALSISNVYARPLFMGKDGYGASSEADFEDYELLMGRLNALAEFAKTTDVRIMVDAEHSYFQPLIDHAALSLMAKFNKFQPSHPEHFQAPLIYNTYQMYIKDGLRKLKTDWERSHREGWAFGAKLVRGAYMFLERERATKMGYPSPINDTIEDTHDMYNAGIRFLLEKIAARQRETSSVVGATHGDSSPFAQQLQNPSLFVATHNANSIEYMIQQSRLLGIKPNSRTVMAGQLLGMHDDVSYTLGRDGYAIYKYVPYGPVGEVLPYLIRRAQENSSVLGTIQKEINNIKAELKRRIFNRRYRHERHQQPQQ